MAGEQNFKVYLSFKDDASPLFKKATEDQIASIKKLGIAVKKEGAGVGVDLDKMATSHEKAGRGMRYLGGEITGVQKAVGSLRNMILVYVFALRPLIDLVKESAEAYARQEDAIKRINFAMDLQGTYSKEMHDSLINLSEGFQSVTRYGDEAVLEVMDKLMTIGRVMPSQLERVTQATLDFASATGKDLATAADIMAKAASGYIGQLSRYGIIIDKNIPATEKFNEVLKYIEQRMGGRAQADVASFAGKIAQSANAMNDLQESIGKLIAEGLNLPLVLDFWKKAFEGMNKAVSGEGITVLGALSNQLSKINEKIAAGGAEAIAKQKPSALWFITGGYSEAEVKRAQDLLVERDALTRAIIDAQQDKANNKMLLEQRATETKLAQEKLAIQETFEERYSSYQRTRASFRLGELKKEYETYQNAFQNNKEALLQIDEWYAFEKRNLDLALLQEAKKHSEMYVTFMQGAAQGMKAALVDGFIKIAKGEFSGLKDVVVDFGNIMLQVIAQMAAIGILKSVGMAAFLGAHTGGYLMNLENSFGYRKKFHSGGEVPATLLEGEGVLNRRGMRSLGVDNLNRLNRGEGGGVGGGDTINNFYIQAIDVKSFKDRLEQHGDIFSNAAAANIRGNGVLRKASQRFLI